MFGAVLNTCLLHNLGCLNIPQVQEWYEITWNSLWFDLPVFPQLQQNFRCLQTLPAEEYRKKVAEEQAEAAKAEAEAEAEKVASKEADK